MITSIQAAFDQLDATFDGKGVPFQAINYLRKEATDPQVLDQVIERLNEAYQREMEYDYVVLWYAIVAEACLDERLIKPVVALFTSESADFDMLSEQGMFLLSALAKKYPEKVMDNVMPAIESMLEEESDKPYSYLYDAFYYADWNEYAGRIIALAENPKADCFECLEDVLIYARQHSMVPPFYKQVVEDTLAYLDKDKALKSYSPKPYAESREDWKVFYKEQEHYFLPEDDQENVTVEKFAKKKSFN